MWHVQMFGHPKSSEVSDYCHKVSDFNQVLGPEARQLALVKVEELCTHIKAVQGHQKKDINVTDPSGMEMSINLCGFRPGCRSFPFLTIVIGKCQLVPISNKKK